MKINRAPDQWHNKWFVDRKTITVTGDKCRVTLEWVPHTHQKMIGLSLLIRIPRELSVLKLGVHRKLVTKKVPYSPEDPIATQSKMCAMVSIVDGMIPTDLGSSLTASEYGKLLQSIVYRMLRDEETN